ncbi:sigma-70 family RNA polymerase sigma factor [Flavobacterium sp.]
MKEKGKLIHLNTTNDYYNSNIVLEIPDTKQLYPQEKMIRQESKQLLEHAIDQLDSKYKTVYVMKELEEMSLKEISEALEITIANVKVRLHRSKEMLKEFLFEVTHDKNIFEFGFSRCDRITECIMKTI